MNLPGAGKLHVRGVVSRLIYGAVQQRAPCVYAPRLHPWLPPQPAVSSCINRFLIVWRWWGAEAPPNLCAVFRAAANSYRTLLVHLQSSPGRTAPNPALQAMASPRLNSTLGVSVIRSSVRQ